MKRGWILLSIALFAGCAKTRFVEASSVTDLNAHPYGATVTSHGTYDEHRWWGLAGMRPKQPVYE